MSTEHGGPVVSFPTAEAGQVMPAGEADQRRVDEEVRAAQEAIAEMSEDTPTVDSRPEPPGWLDENFPETRDPAKTGSVGGTEAVDTFDGIEADPGESARLEREHEGRLRLTRLGEWLYARPWWAWLVPVGYVAAQIEGSDITVRGWPKRPMTHRWGFLHRWGPWEVKSVVAVMRDGKETDVLRQMRVCQVETCRLTQVRTL